MRKLLFGASAAAALALIAGCGGSENTTSPGHSESTSAAPQAEHNADDITFAQGMIPHHAQAVEMAELVPSRSTDPKVLSLATRIQTAQDPEIQQLTEMLKKWGAASSTMNHGSTGHGGGMMTAEEMRKLEQAKGVEFDRMWTGLMIRHHEGAIEMAKTELSTGASSDAKALAQKVVDAQQAEIAEMR